MANSANLTYSGQGYTAGGQVIADGVGPGPGTSNIDAVANFTGDAATATVAVGYIDGVQTLPFTPSAILVQRSGGAGGAITIQGVTGITNAGFTVTAAANFAAATYGLAVRIIR